MSSQPDEFSNDQDFPQTHEFESQGPITAAVRVRAGIVTVTAQDEPEVQVSVSPYDDHEASLFAAGETKVQFKDDRLHIETPEIDGGWIFQRSGRVRVVIRLPVDSRLSSHVGSADVHADGRLADAEIHSGSGDSYVTETAGDLTVHSGSGDIRAHVIGGALRVRTGSGDLTVASVSGEVNIDVASGTINIEDATGKVRASAASGDIRIGRAQGDHVRANAASGDISVGVPVGTKVWLDLSTLSGTTRSDLAMTGEPPAGGAQLNLQVRTLSGDITVHRVGQRAGG